MCSLEVPDLQQSIRDHYSDDDVTVWLVNPVDPVTTAFEFVNGTSTTLPVLMDSGGSLYRSYAGLGPGYAPFPRQVVIDQDGTIQLLVNQYDPAAVRRVIDELLE